MIAIVVRVHVRLYVLMRRACACACVQVLVTPLTKVDRDVAAFGGPSLLLGAVRYK